MIGGMPYLLRVGEVTRCLRSLFIPSVLVWVVPYQIPGPVFPLCPSFSVGFLFLHVCRETRASPSSRGKILVVPTEHLEETMNSRPFSRPCARTLRSRAAAAAVVGAILISAMYLCRVYSTIVPRFSTNQA